MSEQSSGGVRLERRLVDQVGEKWAALVTLDRPEQLNPIDTEVLVTLDGILDEIEADPTCCCVLVTGAGRAFSAGGDLKGVYRAPT
jgi:enoyl-CoA hydratase/carnithine racemase